MNYVKFKSVVDVCMSIYGDTFNHIPLSASRIFHILKPLLIIHFVYRCTFY